MKYAEIKYLYHMTHIKNLASILKYGILAHNNSYKKFDISLKDVNDKRTKKEPIFNRSIHEYAPLYFNPRNAMLYYNKDIQNDIVILGIDKRVLLSADTIFADGNAVSNSTNFYQGIKNLKYLKKEHIFTNWYGDAELKRTTMAEVLVYSKISSEFIQKIYCNGYNNLLTLKKLNVNFEVNKNLYFKNYSNKYSVLEGLL
jgi:hypothetical protein